MLQQSSGKTLSIGLCVSLVVAFLAIAVLLSYTEPAVAQQTSTETAPSTPTLTAQVGEGAVDLSWTEVTGATRYELWVWESVNGWEQIGGVWWVPMSGPRNGKNKVHPDGCFRQ